ncbi:MULTISPECIES: hypothetical protein [Vibrio harveyi group]|uniref:hypothetical protein n=1 Tax=Vibrio harveyi group TaxID=717610 RepID=UPI0012FE72FD|nr:MULTISPECIES: hypothetical protein [Vibrio harveyi group]ELA9310781.1 hypothetical protein [Vibrio parahaemolyticus]MBE3841525.1 hypothetical protein [Vibrio parahaemolyticus]MBE3944058.1 hypothetical protein [Vibrio parahaemolyticus]MBE4112535.1 hypothetical protein [Vibrio parahaemolyticus]HAS6880281.1 hypothetical protein [Vibrio parahaemolyticus]
MTDIQAKLHELVSSTDSPVFRMSLNIVDYLSHNPNKRDLSLVGLRTQLKARPEQDAAIFEAGIVLSSYPFEVLDIKYKLVDENLTDVIQIIDSYAYSRALSQGFFIDDDGETLSLIEMNNRIFPYFINRYSSLYGLDKSESC